MTHMQKNEIIHYCKSILIFSFVCLFIGNIMYKICNTYMHKLEVAFPLFAKVHVFGMCNLSVILFFPLYLSHSKMHTSGALVY